MQAMSTTTPTSRFNTAEQDQEPCVYRPYRTERDHTELFQWKVERMQRLENLPKRSASEEEELESWKEQTKSM